LFYLRHHVFISLRVATKGLRVDKMRTGARDFIAADPRSTGTERDIGAFYYLLNRMSGLSGQSLKSSQPFQKLIFKISIFLVLIE
jgi:hypothetical protein